MSEQPKLEPREQEYDFDSAIDMFNGKGWKDFVRDAKAAHEALLTAAPTSCVTDQQWQYCRGMLDVYGKLIHHEEFMRALRDLQNEQEGQ